MSQENLDVVRRSIELWNEGDLAAFVALHHPDVAVVPPDTWPDGEVTRGREAWLREGMRIKDSWESDRATVGHLHEAGSNVIIQLRWIAKGKDSGIEVETQLWVVYTLSAGSITRVEYFLDRSRALEAVGLKE
jgi:ketosteroid isomerase-like protein